jgi:uncharacterized protein
MGCNGCYEGEIFRQNGNKPLPYDLEAIKAKIKSGPRGPAVLHGGEITLMPVPDIEKLCEAIKEDGRTISMQTNGALITPALMKVLKDYEVNVGVSINGPSILNRDRRAAPHTTKIPEEILIKATDKLTERIENNIFRMLDAGIWAGLITVLSQTNAGNDSKINLLIDWGLMMEARGVKNHRWNLLHQDFDTPRVELTPEQALLVYKKLIGTTFENSTRSWEPFRNMFRNIDGTQNRECWFSPCDPYHTAAVHAVFNDGSEGNCLRTAKDGIPYLRAEDGEQHHRQELLISIPFADGGCGGCPWWKVCYGGCPGEAVDGDWRNKTRFCTTFIGTYEHLVEKRRAYGADWRPRFADESTKD